MLVAVGSFAVAAVLIILLPGPDTLVVVRSIVRGGRSHGVATAAGVLTGLTVWVGTAALGLSALLRASEVGYDVLRFAGAAYLVWLGVQTLRTRGSVPVPDARGRRGVGGTGFLAGLVTNLLNPKVGVFFVTFLPAFVPHGAPVGLTSLLFGAVFVVLTIGYFVLLLAVASRVTRWMTAPRIRRRLDTATGAVLVGFGVRLAVES
jgi:threonine/homoserine/homoserine lactone efflux protein